MVQMIPDPNGRVRSREVGCQWESPEPEERRDVGCQSYLTMRRDAGVQTDLSWRPSGNCFAPQKKRQSERSEFSREKPRGLTLTNHGVQRAQKRKRTWKEEEEEQREEVCGLNFTSGEDLHVHLSVHGNEGSRHGDSKEAENTQSPGRKPAGPLIRSPLESEEQLHDLAAANQDRGRKLHRESGDRGGASGDTAKISSERQMDHVVSDRHLVSDELTEGQQRPKRKMVGPPVRYLVESEKQLRGPTAANRDWGNKPQKKSACRVLSSKVGTDPDKPIGHVVSSGLASHVMSDGLVVSNGHLVSDGLTSHVMSDGDLGHVVLDRLTSHEMSDGHMVSDEHTGCTLLSGHGVLDGQMGHMVSDKWQRPRRKMVGPPIRYLLESEELSCDPPTVNKNCRRKLQKGTVRSGVSSVRATTDLDKQSHVVLDGLIGHVDSYDQLGHVVSEQHRVSDVNIVLDGEMGHVASDEHRRPRRKTVGPPIRYLLESEEQSHGPAVANQDRWRGFKQGGKPQDTAGLAGDLSDTTMIDLEKKTRCHKMSATHMDSVRFVDLDGLTSHVVSEQQRLRRMMVVPPTRYLIESEEQSHGLVAASRNCGMKPQKSSRYLSSSSGDTEKQMGDIASDNLLGHLQAYLVYRDLQSNQDEVRVKMSESGVQLFARLEARRSLKDIEPRLFPDDGGPDHGDVVELYGTEGTGKTELLYHLLCRCVLPQDAGGLETEVAFVDTDYSLDMFRLVSILDGRLSSSAHLAGSGDSVLRSCLSRLLVLHCSSSSQLLLTLHSLETSMALRPGLALLLIDSISAFYWLDRCGGGASITKQEDLLGKCAELLGRLLRDYRITIVATCHAIRRTSCVPSSSSSDPNRPYLCRLWQRLVRHRLLCSRQESTGDHVAHRQVFAVHCTSSSGKKTNRSSAFYVTDAGIMFI